MSKQFILSIILQIFMYLLLPNNSSLTLAEIPKNSKNNICPQDLETLTNQLISDVPAYANRIYQSSRNLRSKYDHITYFVIAGKPEFTPLPLKIEKYSNKSSEKDIYQVFFTTLERNYTGKKLTEIQQYHWLLLTKNPQGWDVMMLLTRYGGYPHKKPPTPPRDNTLGVVGQAVSIWLRDCQMRHH